MNDTEFWNVIETAARDSDSDRARMEELLSVALADYQPASIEGFQQLLQAKLDAAYTWDLWGAAYIINGGCSDDGFEYFRSWVISLGRSIYDSAISRPDSLADAVSPDDDDVDREFESLQYVALRAYEQVTGSKMHRHPRVPLRKPRGDGWDFDDQKECAKRLPLLSAKFS